MNLNLFSKDVWIKHRIQHQFKVQNAKYLDLLQNRILKATSQLDPNIDCTISYNNSEKLIKSEGNHFFYNYGSPAPYLCRFFPESYGFGIFYPNDIYKKVKVDDAELNSFRKTLINMSNSGNFTRYKQPLNQEKIKLPENYILVIMQNTKSTSWYDKNFTDLAEQIVLWSKENKKFVVFKWHPGCVDHNDPQGWFNSLREHSEFASIEYKMPLLDLIKESSQVWSASSMAGIQALIHNKPVSVFGQTEYMEMATVCKTPEEAYLTKIEKNLNLWLYYYVNYYCINIFNEKQSIFRIKQRILDYVKGKSIYDIIVPN